MYRNTKIIFLLFIGLATITLSCATPDVYHIGSLDKKISYAEIKTEPLEDTIPKIIEVTRKLPDGSVIKKSPHITMGSIAKRRAANPWYGGFLTPSVDSLEPKYRIYRIAPGEMELLVNYEYCHVLKREEELTYKKATYQDKIFDRKISVTLEPGKRYLLIGDSSSLLETQ